MTARQGKPDVIFTEFTHVHDVCRGPEFLLDSLHYHEAERPIVAQLYGKDPELFYQAAHVVCELGFDGLDINMGCPSRNVASSGSGAGLIRTPDLAHAIIRAARQGIADWTAGHTLETAGLKAARIDIVNRLNALRNHAPAPVRSAIPLSVKTRLGYDEVIVERWIEHLLRIPRRDFLAWTNLAANAQGEADWAAIGRAAHLVRGSGTLLFGNGDVQSLSELVRRVRETGVDGVLVGRAALGAPWFFHGKEEARYYTKMHSRGSLTCGPSLTARFEILLEHARQFEAQGGPQQFRRMRKHLGWYCRDSHMPPPCGLACFTSPLSRTSKRCLRTIEAAGLIDGGQTNDSSITERETAHLASRCG
jgi:tRNA-dihydrouridine synthase